MDQRSGAPTARFGRLVGAAMVVALAGCGQGGGNGANSTFDDSFNASFHKSAHDSCVTTATGHGAPAATAESFCSCYVGQLDKLTVQQRLGLKADSPEVQQAGASCAAQLAPATNAAQ